MTQSIQKLSDIQKINLNNAVEFLVPYVHAIVKISSEVDLTTSEFKSKITSLYLEINSEDKGRIEASANHNNFEFSLLYTGTRSFVLTIKGLRNFEGFSFMETNKGMNLHDDLSSNNAHVSNMIMNQFLKYYKSPYLITEVYKKFLENGESFI